ncbi:MAG: ABC transporter permease [Roseburia sp.]|nr:ABC transporter permease [Roseburia sp.]MCM1097337.1 ABC transporter permease [Ruminococcus flavefaciens]
MQLNPIVKKDVRVQARSIKICLGVFFYEAILALVFFFAMFIIQQERRYSTSNIYSYMVWLYPVLSITQLVILGVVVPVRTASAISGEKERQTFDIMMTTSMTPFSVILGKVMTAMLQSMFFVVASMPIMALSFIIGGMSWSYLFGFLGIALLVALFAASIGILCSSICKKSITAVILSYGFYLVFFLATALPALIYVQTNIWYYSMSPGPSYSYGENWLLFLLLNPAVYLTEIYGRVMAGQSLVNEITQGTYVQIRGPIRFVASGNHWIVISTILFVAVSFLFLLLAAKQINPIKGRRKAGILRRKKSKKADVEADSA